MSQEKKPANYYGGYSLYRGGASNQAPAGAPPQPQQGLHGARKAAAAFGGDWFANPMMSGMMPPMMPHPFVAPDAAASKHAASSSGAPAAAAAQRPVMPFFGNFFAPMPGSMPSMYKGAPVQRAQHQQHHLPVTQHQQQQLHHHAQKPVVAPAKRAVVPAPSFSEWTAFDAVVPAAHIHRHLDPIGTPAPHSVWEGTPAAAGAPLMMSSVTVPSLMPMTSTQASAFSVWTSPVATQSRSGASTPLKDEDAAETITSSVVASSSALDAGSEEEEWMEHLKSTLHAVLLDEESAAAGKRIATPPKMRLEKEWAQRSLHH